LSALRLANLACLFPADAFFATASGPAWLEDSGLPKSGSAHARVSFGMTDDVHAAYGVILVNYSASDLRRLRAMGFAHIREFAVLPRIQNARLLVPLDSPQVAVATLRALISPYRKITRAGFATIKRAARVGLRFYWDRLCVAQRRVPPLEAHLLCLHAVDSVRLGMFTGWPALRKPTLAVLDQAGRVLSFAKGSDSTLGRRLLQREATTLSRLTPATSLIAPKLLFEGRVDGRYVTVQSGLSGTQGQRRFSSEHINLLNCLMSDESRRVSSAESVGRLQSNVELVAATWRELSGFLQLRSQLEDVSLPVAILHGDFAPWNVRRDHHGLAAIDWEYSSLDGLPLIDRLHYELQVGFLLNDWNASRALGHVVANATTRPLGLQRDTYLRIAAVGLLDYLSRLVEEERASSGLAAKYAELLGRLAVIVARNA
jgi:hypothetical protein